MDMAGAQPPGGVDGGVIATSWFDGLQARRESYDTGSPSSEAEGSTAVYDGGDSDQLRQTRQRSASYPVVIDKEQIIKDAGSNFLCSHREEEDRSGAKVPTVKSMQERSSSCDDRSLDFETGDDVSLEGRIVGALEVSSGRNGKRFLPFNRMDNIFTYDSILEELQMHYEHWTPESLQSLAHDIYDVVKPPGSKLTSRRKIFGTLVRINKTDCITQFIDEGLYDSDLPFYFPSSIESCQPVTRAPNDGERVPIRCFTVPRWKTLERELFEQYQWEFQAPFFEVPPIKGQRKRPIHYALRDNSILPFTEDTEGEGSGAMYSGGYSEVWRVRIHPAHHSHPSRENPYFAVKRLRPTNRTLEMFKQEVDTLKRLSEVNHPHLMRLEATYEHQERFHLIFRWADGNLRDFWERHPDPAHIPRTHAFAVWVIQQCLGLAEALMIIHECPPDSGITVDDQLALLRTNGRHGDIKPENILWFQTHESNHGQGTGRDKLVISDFGLTEFHRDETGLVSPMNKAMSPTYSAPEFEVSETISQSFDIWSLGCVLCKYFRECLSSPITRLRAPQPLDVSKLKTFTLTDQHFIRLVEFFVWYLKGYHAFDQFSKDRAAQDNSVIRMDKYFKVVGNVRTNDGRMSKEAVLKKAVASQFENLHQHPQISELIVDALNFVEEKMLRMSPEKRATSKELVERFQDIYKKASADTHYCLEPVPGHPKRINTDLSTLAPHLFNVPKSELLSPQTSQHGAQESHHKSTLSYSAAATAQSIDSHRIHSVLTKGEEKSRLRDLEVPRSRDVRGNRQSDHSPSTNRSSSRSTYQTNQKFPLPMNDENEQNGKRGGLRRRLRSLLCC